MKSQKPLSGTTSISVQYLNVKECGLSEHGIYTKLDGSRDTKLNQSYFSIKTIELPVDKLRDI